MSASGQAGQAPGKSECDAVKSRYHECFIDWYTIRFLSGDTSPSPCEKDLAAYTRCVEAMVKTKDLAGPLAEATARDRAARMREQEVARARPP